MRAVLWICTLLALPAIARSQGPASDAPDSAAGGAPGKSPAWSRRSLGVWAGASLSPSAMFGTITDRRLLLTGARLEYVLDRGRLVTTAYTFDLHPIAIVTNTPQYAVRVFPTREGPITLLVETDRSAAVGAGMSPLGLQLYTQALGATRLFAGGSAGGIWFNRDMPVAFARRFNFALQVGGGVELAARNGGAVVAGYKFHHLSNGGLARANPGLDGHVFYVGLMRRRAERPRAGDVAP